MRVTQPLLCPAGSGYFRALGENENNEGEETMSDKLSLDICSVYLGWPAGFITNINQLSCDIIFNARIIRR